MTRTLYFQSGDIKMPINVPRVKFCKRCGRPIRSGAYCQDCWEQLTHGVTNDSRCSFCGKTRFVTDLYFNWKLKHTYCPECLQIFIKGLKQNKIPNNEIKRILGKDFIHIPKLGAK